MGEEIQLKQKWLEGEREGPTLLILGGVHGDEFESMAAIRRLLKFLHEVQFRGRIQCIPVVNEAAYWRGQRTAEDGLDLARTCPGRADGSVTERIAHVLSAAIRAADFLIDLHSGGIACHFYPTVGYCLHADSEILAVQRRMARAFNMPVIWGTQARGEGRTLSVARDAGVPAIYAEWMGGGVCDPLGVERYFAGCLNVMGELGMMERQQPRLINAHEIEDDRDEAGHIQAAYQVPFGGFFTPSVKLMQAVKKGDRLGTLSDHLGEREEAISSTQDGFVLVQRVYARIQEGETIGAVLEVASDSAP